VEPVRRAGRLQESVFTQLFLQRLFTGILIFGVKEKSHLKRKLMKMAKRLTTHSTRAAIESLSLFFYLS
jgi:hypothetical protein